MNRIDISRLARGAVRTADVALGSAMPLEGTLARLASRPSKLGLELTNLCNANCVFCPYQHQQREAERMPDGVFGRAVEQFVSCGGGDVELTPIVGESLIDPDFVPRVRHLRSHAEIGRILLITNGILIDKHGVEELLGCGVTDITISTAGFDKSMYLRVYRASAYERMKRNVEALLAENNRRGRPVRIMIALRPDRPVDEVLGDEDAAPILAQRPIVRALRSYSSAGGRIAQETLPGTMRLRQLPRRKEACAYLFEGPVVLSNGKILACHCFEAMDDDGDLILGDIREDSLLEVWTGEPMRRLRESFTGGGLNPTCSGCTIYRDLDCFRSLSAGVAARRRG